MQLRSVPEKPRRRGWLLCRSSSHLQLLCQLCRVCEDQAVLLVLHQLLQAAEEEEQRETKVQAERAAPLLGG